MMCLSIISPQKSLEAFEVANALPREDAWFCFFSLLYIGNFFGNRGTRHYAKAMLSYR